MKRFLIVVMSCFILGFVCPVHCEESHDCSIAKEELIKARDKYFNFLDKKIENAIKEQELKERVNFYQDKVDSQCNSRKSKGVISHLFDFLF
jgi:hypothetical protein